MHLLLSLCIPVCESFVLSEDLLSVELLFTVVRSGI